MGLATLEILGLTLNAKAGKLWDRYYTLRALRSMSPGVMSSSRVYVVMLF